MTYLLHESSRILSHGGWNESDSSRILGEFFSDSHRLVSEDAEGVYDVTWSSACVGFHHRLPKPDSEPSYLASALRSSSEETKKINTSTMHTGVT